MLHFFLSVLKRQKGCKNGRSKLDGYPKCRQKGMSYAEIARKYHIDPRTAKRYAESETRPVYSLSDSKPWKLGPHKEQIAIWLEEAPYSALRIHEKLIEYGFESSCSTVKHFVRGKKSS